MDRVEASSSSVSRSSRSGLINEAAHVPQLSLEPGCGGVEQDALKRCVSSGHYLQPRMQCSYPYEEIEIPILHQKLRRCSLISA